MRKLVMPIVLFVCTVAVFSVAQAGKLADFEADIKSEKEARQSGATPASSKPEKHQDCGHSDDCESHHHHRESASFFELMFDMEAFGSVLGEVIVYGSQTSMERVDEENEHEGVKRRKIGEPLLPYLKLNFNTQYVSEAINGVDLKFEFGKGLFGLEARATRFSEKAVNEKLDFHQLQFLYRMSFGNRVGLNLGLGRGVLQGDSTHKGWLFAAPLLWHDGKHLALEIRPGLFVTDGVSLTEFDVSVLYAYRRLALRLGYRELESPNSSINGPYVGLDFIY